MAESKLKRRTKKQTEEADEVQPEAPKRTLSTRSVDPATVAAAAAAAMGGKRKGDTNYLKLNAKDTQIRILPGDPLFVVVRQNMTKTAGRFNTSLDFGSIFDNVELHNAALAQQRITADDFEKFQQFGDPFTGTMMAIRDAEIKLPKGKAFWPGSKVLFNVINREDNKVYLWEASKTAFEAIMTLVGSVDKETGEFSAGQYPELFDADTGFDIIVTGNGLEGMARRYKAFTPVRESSEVGEFEGEPYSLIEKAALKVQDWDSRARQMFASYGHFAALVGITPEGWGLTAVAGGDQYDPDAAEEEDEG
jgi:hypothetical protein